MTKRAIEGFAGSWHCADGFSDVVIEVDGCEGHVLVRVRDESDQEEAEIYDLLFADGKLSFAAYWPSNGRFIKYRMLLTASDRADVTYTYSGQETWLKQPPRSPDKP